MLVSRKHQQSTYTAVHWQAYLIFGLMHKFFIGRFLSLWLQGYSMTGP